MNQEAAVIVFWGEGEELGSTMLHQGAAHATQVTSVRETIPSRRDVVEI
jgi:hypothetical protein